MSIQALFISADNTIELDGLKLSDGSFANDATLTFTLKDTDGDAISGAENIAMAYVASSNGKYQGTLESSVSLVSGTTYYLEITSSRGTLRGFNRVECRAQFKGAS